MMVDESTSEGGELDLDLDLGAGEVGSDSRLAADSALGRVLAVGPQLPDPTHG